MAIFSRRYGVTLFFICLGTFASLWGEERPQWQFAQGDFAPMFPFKVEKGAPDNITNVQTWGTPWSDTKNGEMLSTRNSQFYQGNKPFHFIGTNLCAGANFCDHTDAERLAQTFARFGIRVVRLHHMDSGSIWGKNIQRTKTEIDPEQLEKLDYLVAQFHKQGIFVNINLHVSRSFDERDGFEDAKTLPSLCKGIDNFEPRMIALQKKYARDLLTHVNPYTGFSYTEDPGVAMIEINNENSVITTWYWGALDSLGPTYATTLREKWNAWLLKKYGSTEKCLAAYPGNEVGAGDERLETGSFPIVSRGDTTRLACEPLRRDFVQFLIDLESAYWSDMRHFVKDELGAKPPIAGTQYQYGSWYALEPMDYGDNHAYWQHPEFPNRFWDLKDYYVNNLAMSSSPYGGILSHLAINRCVEKPYTVSEYDHPYPNLYGAEGNLMAAAIAAFQGWSGLYHFSWSHGAKFDPSALTSFFDMCQNQTKMVHLPACYAILARGDVQSGPGRYTAIQDISRAVEQDVIAKVPGGWISSCIPLTFDLRLALVCWSGARLSDLTSPLPVLHDKIAVTNWDQLPREMGRPEDGEIRNEFGQLRLNTKEENGGFFTVDTPGVKVFTGFVRDRSFDFHGLTLTPGKTRLDWTTVSITAASVPEPADPERLSAGRYLIAATGLMQNTDAKFIAYEEDKITVAAEYGGLEGGEPVLCEGIPLAVTLKGIDASKATLYALDCAGNRKTTVPVTEENGSAKIQLDPQYQTLWYELDIAP